MHAAVDFRFTKTDNLWLLIIPDNKNSTAVGVVYMKITTNQYINVVRKDLK